jgi:hypothetical protein
MVVLNTIRLQKSEIYELLIRLFGFLQAKKIHSDVRFSELRVLFPILLIGTRAVVTLLENAQRRIKCICA